MFQNPQASKEIRMAHRIGLATASSKQTTDPWLTQCTTKEHPVPRLTCLKSCSTLCRMGCPWVQSCVLNLLCQHPHQRTPEAQNSFQYDWCCSVTIADAFCSPGPCPRRLMPAITLHLSSPDLSVGELFCYISPEGAFTRYRKEEE